MSLVTQQKFDELVKSTTHYLQDLVNRVGDLESKVAELETPKKTTTRARKQEATE